MNLNRRTIMKCLGAAAGAAVLPAAAMDAQDPPKLDPKESAAMALGYVDNVSKLDKAKYKNYVEGSTCENCLQLQGTSGLAYRPCTLFPGKLVSASGWCSGWTAEM